MEKKPVVIAVCGKGGVGKTSISALLTRMFVKDASKRVLAIDADPAVGLSYSLGISVTKTVDQIRKDLIARLADSAAGSKEDLVRQLDYDLFAALAERENLAFLAIGRPEGEGCFCQVNALLRELIKAIAGQFDVVVIDGEAGLEQIHRRVMEMVTHLLVVSDASLKGRNVAETIFRTGKEICGPENAGLLLNMLKNSNEEQEIRAKNQLPLLHVMFENDCIREFDRHGRDFFDLPWSKDLEKLEVAMHCFVGMAGAPAGKLKVEFESLK